MNPPPKSAPTRQHGPEGGRPATPPTALPAARAAAAATAAAGDEPPGGALELAPEARLADEHEQSGFWRELKRGLTMTHTELLDKMGAAFEGRGAPGAAPREELEEDLICAGL